MRTSLWSRYAVNDLRRNRGVHVALLVVLTLCAFLMATGAMVMERTFGAVDRLFAEAKPPHFLQMHKGDHDPDALARFAAEHPEIDAWLVEEMLGFDSAALAWSRPATGESGDLSESLVDNLFVTQNERFDFLIDESGAIPQPSPGEVYVPVAYQQMFGLRAGDELAVGTDAGIHVLRVEGFVRDAQMASSLSSATRFLVSPADFAELEDAGGGVPEIIVEYRLAEGASASRFQAAYESDAALPSNGQAVTFPLMRMLNAFSDGLVAMALMLLSLLLVALALLSLRFVIRGTLEDEVREIGAMKAVGVPDRTISRLYLSKYRVMTLLACAAGGLLAVAATDLLTRGLVRNYAAASTDAMTFLAPAGALALVYVIVVGLCRGVLRAVRRIQVVDALVHGSTLDERQAARRARRQRRGGRRSGLATSRGGSMTWRLALLDLRAESRQWVLVPLVFLLASVVMTLPANLHSTLSSPRFVTTMGAPESDLRADVQFSPDVDEVRDELLARMRADDRLTDVRAFAQVLYETRGPEGWQTLRVEVGDYAGGTVEFLSGERPGPGQIALSVLNAEEHGVSVGDELAVRQGGEESTVVVSGVYQDVTSGGRTAKMQGEVTSGAAGYAVFADVRADTDPAAVAADYGARFPGATVVPMLEYVQQTLSYVTDAFRVAAVLALVLGVGVAALVTSLFLTLRLARERRSMGVLSAIGFSTRQIAAQVRLKTLLGALAGTVVGLVLAATAGESLVGLLIASAGLGIAELTFTPNPLLVYVAYPLVLLATGYLGAVAVTARLHGADTSSWLRG